MIFQPQIYYGSEDFPWGGKISPKQFVKFPWILPRLSPTHGSPKLISGIPASLIIESSHRFSSISNTSGNTITTEILSCTTVKINSNGNVTSVPFTEE